MIKYYFRITPYILDSNHNVVDPLYTTYEDLPINDEIKNKIKLWVKTIKSYVEKPNSYYSIKSIHWYALKLKEEIQQYLGEEWKIICCSKQKIIGYLFDELKKVANFHKKEGHYFKAIEYYKGSIALNPRDYEVLNSIAFCYYELDLLEDACYHLKLNIEQSPFHAPAFFNLGLCYRKSNDFVVAGIYFEKAKNLNPENVDYIINYAHNFIDLKFYKMAIEILLAASIKMNGNREILEKLSYAYLHAEEYLESIKLLQELILLYPDDPTLIFKLGFCFSLIDENEKSTKCYVDALKIDPDYGECYYNIALNYHFQGLDHLSVDMYVRALLRNSQHAEHFWQRNNLLLNLDIPDDFKEKILIFGSENGDERAKIILEDSNLHQQNSYQ
ncbi:MAG: hypothetical protein NTX65_12205 [Ignavibacteriales bacterium]|nr:hypothetical protein [Ignavibacteriales bacterium]